MNINVVILSGKKGIGKSSYAIKNWPNYLLVKCDTEIEKFMTYASIQQSIYFITKSKCESVDSLIDVFIDIVTQKKGIIIDNAENIDNKTLKLIINVAKAKNTELIFIFNIEYKNIHRSQVFIQLLEWNIINEYNFKNDFIPSEESIKQYIIKNYKSLTEREFKRIIEITGYNFNNIKKLLWIKNTKAKSSNFLSSDVIEEYYRIWLEKAYTNLSDELIDVLKKSSVIGKIFDKFTLETPDCFNITGAYLYLNDLERTGMFISKYLYKDDYFEFITEDIYKAILSDIPSNQKKDLELILLKYYLAKFNNYKYDNNGYKFLVKAKNIASRLEDIRTLFKINQVLIFYYIELNDFSMALSVINDIIKYKDENINKNYIDYLLTLKLLLLIDLGNYKNAQGITNKLLNDLDYRGSIEYLEYYNVKCLYNCGQIDEAFSEVKKLVKDLKQTSKSGKENQQIYPLTYSIMASIQNHLNLDDNGLKYYTLALNYAYNKIDDKSVYFDILKKCDMFYSRGFSYTQLKKCANHFKESGEKYKEARVYYNLATEMMFNGDGEPHLLKKYFEFAIKVFKIPDENLAYAKNNLAIYYILIEHDFYHAAKELEEAIFIGLSDFTYMTIYLNLSMTYYLLYGLNDKLFKSTYEKFKTYEKAVESRKNRTKYEVMYRTIAKLILDNCDKSQIISTCEAFISSPKCTDFFIPIFKDIYNKAQNIKSDKNYRENSFFYETINNLGIFLAEFRFWD